MKWLFLLLIPFCTFSQNPIDEALEYWMQFQEDEHETEAFSIALETYTYTKLQINNASKEELSKFPLFHSKHINSILQYLRKNQNVLSWIELETLPYFDIEYISIIKPFINLSIKVYLPKARTSIIYRSKIPFEKPFGYFNQNDSTKLIGPWVYHYLKLNCKWNENEVSLVVEKDLGESYFKAGNLFKVGFQTKNVSIIKQLNLGAYTLNIGEGLVHSNGFYLGGNSSSNKILKINKASSESNFQLGACAIIEKGIFRNLTGFAINPRSGRIIDNINESFNDDGIFNSKSKLDLFNTSWDANLILRNQLDFKKLTVAVNNKLTSLSHNFSPTPKYYNTSYSLPKKFWNHSVSYNFFHPSYSMNGEIAVSNNSGWATTHFFKANVAENLVLNFNCRHFSKDYKSLYSNTYKKNSRIQNETGFYTELKYNTYNLNIISRFNYYKNSNSKYLQHLPSTGKSYDQLIRFRIGDSLKVELKYQYRIGPKENSENILDQQLKKYEHKAYAKVQFLLNEYWTFSSRFGYNYLKYKDSSEGHVFAQDLTYQKGKQKLNMRIAVVNSESWDNRFYIYEYDMLHNFSVPVYYDKSTRFYLNYNYKINKNWQFWMKYEMTQFLNKSTIGSGVNEIKGNKKSIFKWQIRYQF
jgi:hypothetical protein